MTGREAVGKAPGPLRLWRLSKKPVLVESKQVTRDKGGGRCGFQVRSGWANRIRRNLISHAWHGQA